MREFLIELIFCTLEAKHNFLLSRGQDSRSLTVFVT